MNWLVYALLGVVLAGTSPVFAKSGMQKANSYVAAALRGTCLFLSAWFMLGVIGTDVNLSGIGQTAFIYLIFSGVATGIVWVCFMRALQLKEVIKVIPIVEGSIILDILVGIFFFKDVLSLNILVILALLIAGVVMMVTKSSNRSRNNKWLIYGIVAMVFTSVSELLYRAGIHGLYESQERFVRYGIALIVVWIVTFATKGYKALRSMSFVNGIYLCLSGFAMGAAWNCFYLATTIGPNTNVEIAKQFDLVGAVVLSCVFLREKLSVKAIFGAIILMIAFLLLLADLPVILL